LLEVLLSVGVIGILAGISLPIVIDAQRRNDLDTAVQLLVSGLRRSQQLSRGSEGDSQWGIRLLSGQIVVFKGSSYAARDPGFDETSAISSAITPGGLNEVVFNKVDGNPASTGSITLTLGSETRSIALNAKGTVLY
jgi:type II secretory pathway pseudopilin PulG